MKMPMAGSGPIDNVLPRTLVLKTLETNEESMYAFRSAFIVSE